MGIYTEEHEIFRRSFKKFVEKEMVPYMEEWEENGIVSREMWKKMGEQGYLCPWLDEQYGGSEAGFEFSIIINEELARAGVNTGVRLHGDITAPYIYKYGTEEQKKKWLPRCVSGDIVLSLAMTEPNAGSDLQAIKTKAVRDGDEYVIDGMKTFITNAISSDLTIVACKTDLNIKPAYKGISLIAVEYGTPGFSKGRKLSKMGLRSQDTGELFFENCRVPVTNLIGEEGKGFFYLTESLQQERLVTTVTSQALAERMLADVIEYTKTREAFGKPICKFQNNAFKIAEMATEVELGRTFLDSLIAEHLEGRDIVKKVSMAKWWITEMANRVAYNSLQLYGGYGYMDEYPISKHFRDVRVHTLYAGTTEIMKLIISRQLGL